MNFDDMLDIITYTAIFKRLIEKPENMFVGNIINYENIITEKPVTNKYLLDLNLIKGMLIIGTFDPNILPQPLQKLLNYQFNTNTK